MQAKGIPPSSSGELLTSFELLRAFRHALTMVA